MTTSHSQRATHRQSPTTHRRWLFLKFMRPSARRARLLCLQPASQHVPIQTDILPRLLVCGDFSVRRPPRRPATCPSFPVAPQPPVLPSLCRGDLRPYHHGTLTLQSSSRGTWTYASPGPASHLSSTAWDNPATLARNARAWSVRPAALLFRRTIAPWATATASHCHTI
jgi:hypothetical protein